ncbi:MAG: hypothetical protein Q9195_009593, partial [Heterodermia aff. obscurata]
MGSQIQVNETHSLPDLLFNDSSKSWIVQKFGGTSVGKFAVEIAEQVVRPGLSHNRIAVVCSARSGDNKIEGTTNRLLRAAREAGNSALKACEHIVYNIQEDHLKSANAYIRSVDIINELAQRTDEECRELRLDLAAAQRIGESPGFVDKIISRGEILSCRFVAALLKDRGISARFVDLSEIINFQVARELNQEFYQKLAATLSEKVRMCGDQIPVLTGYWGSVPGGLLNRIGRGYTDLCAALVAVGLQAEELQIWKEVDGIFTADPRKVPTAQRLRTISPAEAAELTFYGSEVIHPFTMEQVIRARIPIRIKNVINPGNLGTIIMPDPSGKNDHTAPGHDPKLFRTRSSSILKNNRPKRPTAVTIKHKIIVINVHSNKRSLLHDFYQGIFSTLSKWRLSVDLISTSEVHVSMALHSESAVRSGGGDDEKEIVDSELRNAIDELQEYGTTDIIDGMAIVSLVGKQMKNMI